MRGWMADEWMDGWVVGGQMKALAPVTDQIPLLCKYGINM